MLDFEHCLWEVETAKTSAGVCKRCGEKVIKGTLQFHWCARGSRPPGSSADKHIFHASCAVVAGQQGPYSVVEQRNIRKSSGLTGIQRAELNQILNRHGTVTAASPALKAEVKAEAESRPPSSSSHGVSGTPAALDAELVARLTTSTDGFTASELAECLPHHNFFEIRSRLEAMHKIGSLSCKGGDDAPTWYLAGATGPSTVAPSQCGPGCSTQASRPPSDIRFLNLQVSVFNQETLKLELQENATSQKLCEWLSALPDLCPEPGKDPPCCWHFPMGAYENLLVQLGHALSSPTDVPLPPWVFKMWSQAAPTIQKENPSQPRYVSEVPNKVRATAGALLPYQLEAVQFALARNGRVLIGDDMGLGKTVMALAIVFEYADEWPVLVVCPAILRHQWRSQVLHWLGHIVTPEQVQVIMTGKDELQSDSKFVIISYHLLAANERLQRTPKNDEYNVIILDESHYIKEHGAQRTRTAIPLLQHAKRAVLLSGTPSLNNAAELHPQLQGLLSSGVPSFLSFAGRYAKKRVHKFHRKRVEKWFGVKHEAELGVVMRAVMIRRRKEEVLTQLPAKRRQKIMIAPIERAKMKELKLKMQGVNIPIVKEGVEAVPAIQNLFKLTCQAKLSSICEYISLLLEGLPDEKLLLFGHHHEMIDAITETLTSMKLKFVKIDGRTKQVERADLVHTFQQEKEVRCAVLSITACSHGLNLTAASTVVFCELYWVPGLLEQCEARAHRLGQARMVDVHYLVMEGSPDEKVFSCLGQKKEAVDLILDGKADVNNFRLDALTFSPPGKRKAPSLSASVANEESPPMKKPARKTGKTK